jgi:predicted phosphodiesterase
LTQTHVVLSDIHVPYQDRRAQEIVCQVVEDLKPDGLIVNGDGLDFFELSRHNRGSVALLEGKRIKKTWDEGLAFRAELDSAAGSGCKRKEWLEGNHENRLYRWIRTDENAVFIDDEGVSIPHRLALAPNGWIYKAGYPKKAHAFLGKLLVTHGRYCGKYPAARHLEKYQTSCLVGHTHTVQTYHGSTWGGQRMAHCAGFLADENSEAMEYADEANNWIKNFTVVHVQASGEFQIVPCTIIKGRLIFNDREYPRKPIRKRR